MAAMRARAQAAIGSTKWVHDEREQAGQFIEQEVEEFAFSARNEFEWLNEHMAEIFSANQFEVTEVFKTPGKLRGKTPHTGRKHTPATGRQPLTDIFSSNTPNNGGTPKNDFYQKLAPFQVAEDKENGPDETSPKRLQKSPLRAQPASQSRQASPKKVATPPLPPKSPLRPASAKKSPSPFRLVQLKQAADSRSTGDSFVSAKETQTSNAGAHPSPKASSPAIYEDEAEAISQSDQDLVSEADEGSQARDSTKYSVSTATAAGFGDALDDIERNSPNRAEPNARDVTASPSDTSSPGRPVIRKKSSLNFASLPAREPLAKKSVGARISHARASEKMPSTRDSTWNRQSQAPTSTVPVMTNDDTNKEIVDAESKPQVSVTSDASKLQSKTSTQRLHERITMLGKTNQPRPSKSIPSAQAPVATTQAQAKAQPSQDTNAEDVDDDWIGPINQTRTQQSFQSTQPSTQPSIPGSFNTTISGWNTQTQDTSVMDSQPTQLESPRPKTAAPSQATYPDLKGAAVSAVPASTTPVGSPMAQRWNVEGPLSASKARFNSFLKSAKGIFASSAASSAQAKLDILKSPASKSTAYLPNEASIAEEKRPATAHPTVSLANDIDEQPEDELQLSPLPDSPPRRRSSQRIQQKKQAVEEATTHKQADADSRSETADNEDVDMTEDTIAGPAKTTQPQKGKANLRGLATQSGELRHPTKANKGNKVTKPVPGKSAMSVRLPSQKTIGTFGSSMHSSAAESRPGPSTSTTSKPPTLTKKGSNSSLKSGMSGANKSTAASNTRVKALDAAAKKKELEQQKEQKKADEKRERERKRADMEAQRQKREQEQKAAEQRREREEQEAKAAAQKQRREREEQERLKAEKQTAEIQRKEALRRQAEVAKAKARQAEAIEQDQPRPVSRGGDTMGGSIRPHMNPAKPKRYFQPDEDERPPTARPAATTPGYATTMNGSKRRKTGEEEPVPGPSQPSQSTRPTMAPPVRASMTRKQEGVPNRFAHGFMASSNAGTIKPGQSSYALNQQPKTPHTMNDLAKFSSAKIPFADNPNPPPSTQAGPSRNPTQKTPVTAHKSSPVPNGDNISLPEIATDSEDESDDDFVAPDWTQSPELRALLERQQLVDPMRVFGPIGELKMEEVFKGNKDRLARFRARTSSANWSGPDRLTEEERRRDREARERLERDGGWSFRPDL